MTKHIAMIIAIYLPIAGLSQCDEDLFGFWKADDGKFIKFIKYDSAGGKSSESVIGDKDQHYLGYHYSEGRNVKLISYKAQLGKDSVTNNETRIVFEFAVLQVNKQMMTIIPVSEEMKKLFGADQVVLFNDFYISFDNFVLDSLYYTRARLSYTIQIDKVGNMILEEQIAPRRSKIITYSAKLDEAQFHKLEELVFRSQILSMSACDLRSFSCSDCYPTRIQVYHNDRFFYDYYNGMVQKSVFPLISYLINLIDETKWKQIRQRDKQKQTSRTTTFALPSRNLKIK
jgi:hypothetical protein